MKSVKMKIIILVLSCIIASSIVIGGISILSSRQVVAADSVQIMNLLCDNRRDDINTMFVKVEQSVDTLSVYAAHQLTDLEKFKQDAQYVEEYTESLLSVAINAAQNTEGTTTVYIRYNPQFTNPESGFFYCRSKDEETFKKVTPTNILAYDKDDVQHVGWFYIPAENQKGTWMQPYYNQNIQDEIISYVVPFYIGGELIGVVGMDISFENLRSIVAQTSVYESGYAYLTDEDANIIYHRNLKRGTQLVDYNQGEFKEMAMSLVDGTPDSSTLIGYTYEGVHKKAVYRVLENGMRLIISAPVSEIDHQANTLLKTIVNSVLIMIVFASFLSILFTRRLVRPLLELTNAAKKVAAGDLNVSVLHHSNDEVGELSESFRQTVVHLEHYFSHINQLAYKDPLTGVRNKTSYLDMIHQLDDMAQTKLLKYAVIVFDLNDLKSVNDSLGHEYGDSYIVQACQMIGDIFLESEMYRIGGDEFVVLLENTRVDLANEMLHQLDEDIQVNNRNHASEFKVSIAWGLAYYDKHKDKNFHDVFQRADHLMYENKTFMKHHHL